jgi:hypothetical protein
LYVNFFLPSFKLQSKRRDGAMVTKRYDKPTTPYERLLASDKVSDEGKQQLRQMFSSLDPVSLLSRIRDAQRSLRQLEFGASGGAPAGADAQLDRFVKTLGIVWKEGEVRPTHRKPITGPRALADSRRSARKRLAAYRAVAQRATGCHGQGPVSVIATGFRRSISGRPVAYATAPRESVTN